MRMIYNKHLQWRWLECLKKNLPIADTAHQSLWLYNTWEHRRRTRKTWCQTKNHAPELREAFLLERAEEYAVKMHTDQETALKMIKKAEEQKKTYSKYEKSRDQKKEKPNLPR